MREAARNRGRFLAVLSHELRNPLAPITNSLYILDHAVPGELQARRAQAVIGRQVGQLSHLVDDLLDSTRMSSKQTLRRGPDVSHASNDSASAVSSRPPSPLHALPCIQARTLGLVAAKRAIREPPFFVCE